MSISNTESNVSFESNKVYSVDEVYSICNKIGGEECVELFKSILSPLLENKSIAHHLIQYEWIDNVFNWHHSSIEVENDAIRLYVDGVGDWYNDIPCFVSLAFKTDVLEKLDSVFCLNGYNPINIQFH